MSKFGLNGFRDRRRKSMNNCQAEEIIIKAASQENGNLVIETNYEKELLSVPAANPVQQKIILLTLGANGRLSTTTVAEQLDCTPAHVRILLKKLTAGDVSAILDKRAGQTTDYRVNEEVKGELILQWAVNSVTGRRVSSPTVSRDLNERCAISLPARTVRDHLKKLGLTNLAKALSQLVKDIKKGSRN